MNNPKIKISVGLSIQFGPDVIFYDDRYSRVSFQIDHADMIKAIELYTKMLCPTCFVEINSMQVVCDDCYEKAKTYRELYG